MTRDDIIRMAREAGCNEAAHPMNPWSVTQEALERFAALVAAAEREEWAKLCELEAQKYGTDTNELYVLCCAYSFARGKNAYR